MAEHEAGDLRLVGLTKSFGEFTAVHPLDLTIPQGSFFALLGPSGCGKTTTLRMVAGLEDPTGGQILIGETDITRTRAYQRNVNTVFQSYALFPHMSVMDNVAFGLRRRGDKEAKSKAQDALDLVELGHAGSKKPNQLSGGMQQRVALARALVNRPDVLLLDEPLGALDLKLRRQMQIELKRIQQEVGLTFIHVTHDQEEAMTMADTIAVMNAGHLEQLGDPATLYEHPASTFVANFLGQSNLLRARITGSAEDGLLTADVHGEEILVDAKNVPEGLRGRLGRGAPREAGARRGGRPQPPARPGHRRVVHRCRDAVPRADAVGLRRRRRAAERRQRPRPARREHHPVLGPGPRVRPRRRAERPRRHRRGARRWLRSPASRGRGRTTPPPSGRTGSRTPCWLPGLLWLVVFFVLPMITLGSQSLQEGSVEAGYTFTGNVVIYVDALQKYWPQLLRSIGYAATATVAALVLAYPLAYYIAQKAGRWKNVMLVLVIAPFFTSFLIRTLAWRTILSDTGPVTSIAQKLHLTDLLQAWA